MKMSIMAVLLGTLAFGMVPAVFADAPYVWHQIGYGSGTDVGTKVTDINNANEITGTSWNGKFAYSWNSDGDMSYLYIKPDASTGTHGRSYGNAINANGDVVTTASGSMTDNVYLPCVFTDINPPAHAYNPIMVGVSGDRASAINTTYIAGYIADGVQGSSDATIWTLDGIQIYSYDSAGYAKYVDVSENDIFVGQYYSGTAYGISFITRYDGSAWTTSDFQYSSPSNTYTTTQIKAINGDGTMFCAYLKLAWSSAYSQAAVFQYNETTETYDYLQMLAQSNNTISSADAISPNGTYIVGQAAGVPVLWSDEDGDGSYVQTHLEDLMPQGEYANWTNIILTGVNDWGSIVGYGNYNGQTYTTGFFRKVLIPTTCEQTYFNGFSYPQDLNQDCYVDMTDFVGMAAHWLDCIDAYGEDCQEPTIPTTQAVYYTPELPNPGAISFTVASNNTINVTVDGHSCTVQSQFSMPNGSWTQTSNSYFTLNRSVTLEGDVIVVQDVFTNQTAQPLGIMQRHEIPVSGQVSYYLNGLPRGAGTQDYFHSKNGTSFVQTDTSSIGLLALNDAFSIHAENYIVPSGGIGLCDQQLVIPGGASYTAQWAIVPSANGDYWDFINTLRDYLDVNFPINGSSAIIQTHRTARLKDWTAEQFRELFHNKGCFFAISSLTWNTEYEGQTYPYIFDYGTAVLDKAHNEEHEDDYAKWRIADPNVNIMGYFHCFIDSNDYSRANYADAAILDEQGDQVEYGQPYYPIFFPTLTNNFGAAIEPIIDLYLDTLGTDGIFWDEIVSSRTMYHYGSPWDMCSGDIDPTTHQVLRQKSSVSLITKPWRLALAQDILQRGYLIGNGTPVCQDMRNLKFPCFAETADPCNAARQQLYSPIILGDSLTEDNELDAYQNMLEALDYGCVYYWYGDNVIPTHTTLTSQMFPITPMRLGPGFIIGQERIVTKVNGYFGWGDSSEHDVFMYDNQGREVTDYPSKAYSVNGHTFTRIVLPHDGSAVIVKK